MSAVGFKVLVAIATAVLGAAVFRSRLPDTLSQARFLWLAASLQLIPVCALFLGIYVIGREQVSSDVPGYYLPAARAVAEGKLPFRDFATSYAPLFPYVSAALVRVWDSGKVFALFAMMMNMLGLIAWHRAAASLCNEATARRGTILYASSGHIAIQALLGSNQCWIAAALGWSVFLTARDRGTASGLIQCLAVCTTKFLTLLFWPVLWVCAQRRRLWILAAALPASLVYGFFVFAGGSVFEPLRRESPRTTSGNLAYLLEPLLPAAAASNHHVVDAVALLALGGSAVWLFIRALPLPAAQRPRLLLPGLVLLGIVFMLFSKKSYTGYAVFFLYPATSVLVSGVRSLRGGCAFFLLFNVLLVSEPSLWFQMGGYGRALSSWLKSAADRAPDEFVLLDACLIACYVFIAWLSVQCLRQSRTAPSN